MGRSQLEEDRKRDVEEKTATNGEMGIKKTVRRLA
jgi:hypothetical protein